MLQWPDRSGKEGEPLFLTMQPAVNILIEIKKGKRKRFPFLIEIKKGKRKRFPFIYV